MQSAKAHYNLNEYKNKATTEAACTCMANKLAAKYNSEAEMEKDAVHAGTIIEGCLRDAAFR